MNSKEQDELKSILGRRQFLGGCAALTSTSILSSILQLQMTNSAVAAVNGADNYKAMVCIFLYGGNDSFNMLMPRRRYEYDRYAAVRGDLAIERDEQIWIPGPGGRGFGVHPNMPELASLYRRKKASFVANVGTLIEPLTVAQYRTGLSVPRGLFSHNDQQQAWQSSVPQSQNAVGWAGRMADIINDEVNTSSDISMNISINNVNVFQTGRKTVPYVISPSGATLLQGHEGSSVSQRMFAGATNGTLNSAYNNVLKKQFQETRKNARDAANTFQDSFENQDVNTVFPNTSIGSQLKAVAKSIKARGRLGTKRQTFFVSMGGYDTHDEVLNVQSSLLSQLSVALKAFYDATVELGVEDQVTTFSASDFGRTLTSNGRGSDHAWGGNQFVMGGSVDGGKIFGDYPTNLNGGSHDIGRGRLLPTTAVDEMNAELARWYGVSNNRDLEEILPNIRNFYTASNSGLPIGFMKAGSV